MPYVSVYNSSVTEVVDGGALECEHEPNFVIDCPCFPPKSLSAVAIASVTTNAASLNVLKCEENLRLMAVVAIDSH